ncbi:MAG: DUF4199 domain-containing protein [Aestuariibacter sp.]|nr:DUF4199 domain-containing protein [Aestuariibacter sp.]
MSEEIATLKEEEKKSTESERETHSSEPNFNTHSTSNRQKSSWGGGMALIVIGFVFLFANLTDFHFDNWWAFFILIPAFSNLGNALRNYQRNGRLTHSGRGAMTGGLMMTLVASVFLFNLSWGNIWPFFLIVGGVSALVGNWLD